MNPSDYALVCKNSYANNFAWNCGFNVSGVVANMTTISGDPVLVFRGSTNPVDWIRDFDAMIYKTKHIGVVHNGFYQGMPELMKACLPSIRTNSPISLTGHSLGGARARIAAAMLITAGIPVKNLVTFGSPKPGFDQMAEIIQKSNTNHVSYRNANDPVTELPVTIPPLFDYVHTENYIRLSDIGDTPLNPFDDHLIDNYIKAIQAPPRKGKKNGQK